MVFSYLSCICYVVGTETLVSIFNLLCFEYTHVGFSEPPDSISCLTEIFFLTVLLNFDTQQRVKLRAAQLSEHSSFFFKLCLKYTKVELQCQKSAV